MIDDKIIDKITNELYEDDTVYGYIVEAVRDEKGNGRSKKALRYIVKAALEASGLTGSNRYYEAAGYWRDEAEKLEQEIKRKDEALEKIAKLGGVGGNYGNSDGNMIARQALERKDD